MVYLGRAYQFKFFKGCLPQILLGPFLNTLSHLSIRENLSQVGQTDHSLGRPYHFKFFKGCLPQIVLGPFLNTLSQINVQSQHLAQLLLVAQQLKSVQNKNETHENKVSGVVQVP